MSSRGVINILLSFPLVLVLTRCRLRIIHTNIRFKPLALLLAVVVRVQITSTHKTYLSSQTNIFICYIIHPFCYYLQPELQLTNWCIIGGSGGAHPCTCCEWCDTVSRVYFIASIVVREAKCDDNKTVLDADTVASLKASTTPTGEVLLRIIRVVLDMYIRALLMEGVFERYLCCFLMCNACLMTRIIVLILFNYSTYSCTDKFNTKKRCVTFVLYPFYTISIMFCIQTMLLLTVIRPMRCNCHTTKQ
jgi:hypothetical protein